MAGNGSRGEVAAASAGAVPARVVAERLAYEFLLEGKYEATSGPVEVRGILGAASAVSAIDIADETSGFGNISVQSVGYEEGSDEPKVHVYLNKSSRKLVASFPDEIDGVPIRAHKMGPITVRPEAAYGSTNNGHLFERNGRICCGSSVAPTSEASVGTLGAIVRRHDGLFLLSNNHVFAGCNHVPKGQPILSPGANDGRAGMRAPGEIGRHHEIHEMRSGSPNFVNPCDADIALAAVTDEKLVTSWQGDPVLGYDTPTRILLPTSDLKVKKFGRTTALSHGVIEARVTTPTPVAYNAKHFRGTVWFTDIWTVRSSHDGAFALPGDSGSLVVTADGKHAVGLVFAANKSGEYAWMIPMACISEKFGNLQLVGGHGV